MQKVKVFYIKSSIKFRAIIFSINNVLNNQSYRFLDKSVAQLLLKIIEKEVVKNGIAFYEEVAETKY